MTLIFPLRAGYCPSYHAKTDPWCLEGRTLGKGRATDGCRSYPPCPSGCAGRPRLNLDFEWPRLATDTHPWLTAAWWNGGNHARDVDTLRGAIDLARARGATRHSAEDGCDRDGRYARPG